MAARERIEYLDGLRASLMLLGIPFHAALAFGGTIWLITSPVDSTLLRVIAEFLHVWRMPTFFIVAGFFATMILARRQAGPWFKGRLRRLGIPLLFGIIVLSPLQSIIIGYSRGGWSEALAFFQSKLWPPSAAWTMHLWFLLELLLYCAVLAGLAASPVRHHIASTAEHLVSWSIARPALSAALALVGSVTFVVGALITWQVVDGDRVFVGLLSRNFIVFAPAFLVGALLGLSIDNLKAFLKLPVPVTLTTGLLSIALVITIEVVLQADTVLALVLQASAWTVGGLSIGALAFRLAAGVFHKPRASVTWLVDSSLVIYLVHQPFILLFGSILMTLGIYSVPGWALTVVATFLASIAFYEVVVRVPVVWYLMNGTARRGTSIVDLARVPVRVLSRRTEGAG